MPGVPEDILGIGLCGLKHAAVPIGQDGNPPANFYWGKLEAIWSLGEMAMLKNAQGEVISTYIVGQ